MENTARHKSELFGVCIINMYKRLCKNHREYDLFRQILRSGTSIGANLAEAECAISMRDFLNKLYIALKECAETIYWLKILNHTNHFELNEFQSIMRDAEELKRMLTSSTKTICERLKAEEMKKTGVKGENNNSKPTTQNLTQPSTLN